MSNSSSIITFLLLAFTDTRELQLLHFWLFLGIYLAALLGNGLIITAIACNHRLHTPMYFFLLNLNAWGIAFFIAVLHKTTTFSIPLCQGNAVDQFFCEIPQILKLSCSDASLREVGLLVFGVCAAFMCFIFIVVSYVQIFRAVLRIPSQQGRHKAFSTCLPHLAVVSLFISTGAFSYLKPTSISSTVLNFVVSLLYSVVPPAVNPLIYSMRNKELKDALWKLTQWMLFHT